MRYPNLNSILFAQWRRIVSFVLAMVLFTTSAPFPALSVESGEQGSGSVSTPSSGELIYDYDTLHITRDGEDIAALDLLHHEKIELSADGVAEDATYQWQVQHPEKDDVWVNVYDGTKQTISVTMALVENVLRENGTAKLRCRAYTDTYAYLSNPVTVTLLTEKTAQMPAMYAAARSNDGIMLAADEPAPEFVTITIEYVQYDFKRDAYGNLVIEDGNLVYDEGKQAFTSYMATIHGGTDLNTTVHFPTMVGYDSYIVIDGVEQKATSYEIDVTDVKNNIVYTVKYLPAEVDYVVRYFFQNIYDDLYVENTSLKVNGKGFTGSVPSDSIMDKHIAGFTSLYYQPDAIAADGSTVFEVFYERNYYLMEFDCDGGYGAETVYVRYGSYISVPQPVRAGYVFQGWDLVKNEHPTNPVNAGDGAVDVLPATMPEYNSAYKAVWKTAETTYTVVYWRENADDSNYSYWDSVQIDATSNDHVSATAHTSASGLDESAYFTYNAEKTVQEESKRTDLASDGKVIVEGDGSTVVNVYYSRNVYTLQFNIGNNTFTVPSGGHRHTDGNCTYKIVCGIADHVHSAECVSTLTCTIPEHNAHTAGCITCGKTEHIHGTNCSVCNQEGHTHNDDCCGLTEHTHSTDCYSLSGGNWGEAYNGTPNGTMADNGIVRTGNYNNYSYYYKIGDTWYQITGLSSWNGYGVYYEDVIITKKQSCLDGHSHGDGKCDYSSCVLHSHTEDCYRCGQLAHVHSKDCCTLTEHVHDIACYNPNTGYTPGISSDSNTTNNAIAAITDPKEGYIYRYNRNGTYHNFFYTSSGWYYLGTGNQYRGLLNGTISNPNQGNYTVSNLSSLAECDKDVHSHDDGNCSYCTSGHIHSDSCMDCGFAEHTHSDACYKDVIHTHTDACYTWTCGASAHTHTDECYSDCTKPENYVKDSVYYIEAKYNQTIGDIWPTSAHYSGLYGWSIEGNTNTTAVSKKINMTTDLCDTSDGVRVITPKTDNTSYTVHLYYMFESFDQTSPANGNDRKLYNGVYYDKSELYYQDARSTSNQFSQKDITGMVDIGVVRQQVQGSEYNNFLYYNRNKHTFSFHNVNEAIQSVSNLMFEHPLKDVMVNGNLASAYVPPYPTTYEPNAYEFGGWYTTPECFDGTEVDWETITMPDSDLTLYAKWTPILRNVTFYSAYSDIPSATNPDGGTPFMSATGVPHGTTVGSAYLHTPEWPEDLDQAINNGAEAELYDFVGWFYMDEDNKKKFAPDSMEITRDLILFAEWQTSIDTTYEVEYVLKEDASKENTQDGNAYSAGSEVAETITAHSSVGKTKTFAAKGLGELHPAFRKKFFPTVNTHSILMEPNSSLNKFTFEYVYDDTVYYKVRYVDYATRTELRTAKIAHTEEAIITEKFLPIEGYIPQNFYIRKALAYDGNADENSVIDENVITFYYVKDTEHGLYSIEYYLENADSTDSSKPENYYQYESIVGSDDLKLTIKAPERTYDGFTHVPSLNTVITYNADGTVKDTLIGVYQAGNPPQGELDYTGLTIKVYYKRNEYPYIIEYREYGAAADAPALVVKADGSGTDVANDKAKYDSVLTHTADASFEKDGLLYEYYIENPTNEQLTKSTTIRQSAKGEENKLIFYYKKHEVTVIYTPVCTVSGVDDFGIVSLYSERAATAAGLSGSTATAGSGFKFEGWYLDEDCTNPVESSWVTGTTLKPGTLNTEANIVNYYALFSPVLSSMTITKNVDVTTEDNFLFRVKGVGKTAYIDIIVSINGAGSVTLADLPVGDYIVTELTNWSWEYEVDSPSYTVTVTESNKPTVTFTNTYVEQDWLGGEGRNENKFN